MVRLEAEYDNLREALSWSLENEPHTALRLATALARFWEISSHFLEGSRWLEEALRRNGSAEAAARAKALTEAGTFAHHRGQYDQATVLHGEALDLYQELGDEHGVAFALLCLGVQKDEQGDHERAKPLFEEALALSRKTGDKRTISYAIHNLAEVARLSGDYERAKTLGMEAFAVYREMDDKWMIARILGWLGILSVYNIDDREAAAGFLREGLALNQKIGNWEYVAFCLEGFAGLAGAKGEGVRAARLWGAADALRRTIGSPFPGTDRPYFERSMAAARDQLDGAAWEQGRAISSEEAVEYALSGEEPALEPASLVPEEPPTSEPMDMLTPREQEIALLVARGLTNRRISSRLGISERTAGNHVARVLRKLGLSSRVQLATWATERR